MSLTGRAVAPWLRRRRPRKPGFPMSSAFSLVSPILGVIGLGYLAVTLTLLVQFFKG